MVENKAVKMSSWVGGTYLDVHGDANDAAVVGEAAEHSWFKWMDG